MFITAWCTFSENDSSQKYDMVGWVLHGLIFAVVTVPVFATVVPIFLDNVDPTYFLLRNPNFLSFRIKLMVRILIIITTVPHLSVAGVGFLILLANVLLLVTISLRNITPLNPSHFGKVQFIKFFMQYRQLQIINRVWNDTCYLPSSLGLFLRLVVAVLLSYILIKLKSIIPIPMTFIFSAIFLGGASLVHLMIPVMVEIKDRSRDFKRTWKLCRFSACCAKQIGSCDTLRVHLGGFCSVTEKSRGIFFSMMTYYTLSLIIAL